MSTPAPSKVDAKQVVLEKSAHIEAGCNYFDVLDLPPDATSAQVRTAYFSLAKIVHPDSLALKAEPGLHQQATVVFRVATEAYNTLNDPARRSQYIAQLNSVATSSSTIIRRQSANADEEARILSHRANLLLSKRAWAESAALFRDSLSLLPDKVDYKLGLGWAVFNDPSMPEADRFIEAKALWDECLRIDDSAAANYYLALWYKAKGDTKFARKHLDRVIELQPKHIEAQRELRLLAMRQSKAGGATSGNTSPSSPKPSFLERLFGKR